VIGRRLLAIIPLVVAVSIVVFSLQLLLPGDPAVTLAGENPTQERVTEIRRSLGLDKPFVERYGDWAGDALQGDFGRSLYTNRPVSSEISTRWSVTAMLLGGALVLALLVGIPAGLLAGYHRGGWVDRLVTFLSSLGVALPDFLIGVFLVVVFSVWLDVVPIAGYTPVSGGVGEWFRHMIIPWVALSAGMTAQVARQLRASVHEVLQEGYMRTARAMGLRRRTRVVKYTLRVAASPALSVLSVQAARLAGGAVLVESVFQLPGLGRLMVDAVQNRDLPVLQGIVPLAVVVAVVVTLLADLGQLLLNPRLRS
jgi:peptide/nickel transport system permease protein